MSGRSSNAVSSVAPFDRGYNEHVSRPAEKAQNRAGNVNNMLLTKPLASVPGKGLLDKSFGGNVLDDGGKSLDQVLFTGDGGINSHTWLVIDGMEYDPVMGTRGAELAASIDET